MVLPIYRNPIQTGSPPIYGSVWAHLEAIKRRGLTAESCFDLPTKVERLWGETVNQFVIAANMTCLTETRHMAEMTPFYNSFLKEIKTILFVLSRCPNF